MKNFGLYYAQAARWAFPVLLILLIISVVTCNSTGAEVERQKNNLTTNEERTKQVQNQNGQLVAMNESILVKASGDIHALTDTIFNLKDREGKLIASVNSFTKIVQAIKFTGKEAVYIDRPGTKETVFLPQPDDTNLIRVPRRFSIVDSTIILAGTVRRNSVNIDSLFIPNTVSIRTVTEKTGFLHLGRREAVQVINSNPAISSKVSNVILKPRASAWNRFIKPVIAFGAGVFVAGKIK